MKGHFCYTTRDNAEVKLKHDVVVVPVSTKIHQPCIHKYCDFHSWWTALAWYLTDQVNSNQVLKKLATLALCSVKIWMAVVEQRTAEVYSLPNHSMEEAQLPPVMKNHCSLN